MEAIGRLAGGVAHDFNNLLTVLNGYSEIILTELATDHPSRALLAEIRKAGERASTLTRQLLAFSRAPGASPAGREREPDARGDSAAAPASDRRKNIELAFDPDTHLGAVKVDPGQFEHAILNLAVNARDAMPNGGRLSLETRAVTHVEDGAGSREAPKKFALVVVRDTGHGMDTATMARVFEPFFTTKPPGKGTGLGLAMVYGFVKQSGGFVELESAPGRGTQVRMYLPVAREKTPIKPAAEVPEMPMGSETILLVEDEDAVRQLSKFVLESSGYTVIEARDGKEALELAERHTGPLDLLVSDLVMPKVGGQELAARLTKSHPLLRVLFVSGYPDEEASAGGLGPHAAFLQKPCSPAALSSRVRELLDAARDERS